MFERRMNFHNVFNAHIEVLIYETGKNDEEWLRKLQPADKLEIIERNFYVIQTSSKTTESLRMEGICQSYNAKDSALYRDLKFMQDILEDKDDDELE